MGVRALYWVTWCAGLDPLSHSPKCGPPFFFLWVSRSNLVFNRLVLFFKFLFFLLQIHLTA